VKETLLSKHDKMEINVIQEKANPLFSRKEVHVTVADSLTPSLTDARKIVAEQFSVDENLVRVRTVDSRFGSQTFTIIADIYDSLEEFNRIVKKTKQEVDAEKKAEAEARKAEAEAKAAEEEAKKAAEAPSEEAESTEEAQ